MDILAASNLKYDAVMEKNYYQILGASNQASYEEIKILFRSAAKKYHPDVSQYDTTDLFQQINAAYEVLSNPELRKEYDHLLSQQTKQQHSTSSQQQHRQSTTDEYRFQSDEYSNRVMYLLNTLTSCMQISEILPEINSLLENIRNKWTTNDYLRFSSMIAILLMNVVINDANRMVQDYHAYIEVDEKGLKMALQKLKQIGSSLEMDNKTSNIYSKNKYDLETALLHNCSGKKINSIAKTTTRIIMLFLLLFVIFNGGIYVIFPFIFLAGIVYYIIYFIIGGIISIIDSLYRNIKVLFI